MNCFLRLSALSSLTLLLFINQAQGNVTNPKERISFWRQNFTTLTAKYDNRVKKAHTIFTRLINVAGSRNNISPMLHIIDSAPKNIPLPMAIPDGWIIISKGTLDFAYENPEQGDDLLAFILAHEIAHQMEDDFWHMKFFQAINASKQKGNEKILSKIRQLAAESDKMVSKELRADEQGLTFTVMAGFDTQIIFSNKNNLFSRWVKRFATDNFSSTQSTTHPSPRQRELAIHSRLKQIHQKSQLFNLGVWLYQAGHYDEAKGAFEEFRHYFPGREVNHNIALCYHQLALKSKKAKKHLAFRTTLSLDPYTYASQTYRSFNTINSQESHLLKKAIEFYKLAISQDKNYIFAYNNLSSAYLENNEPYKAIALLKDAIKIQPDNIRLMNNLAIAFYHAENKNKAKQLLQRSLVLDKNNADTLYNLGVYHTLENNEIKSKQYWRRFLNIETSSGWSKKISNELGQIYKSPSTHVIAENINNIQIGNYIDELPANWKLKEQFSLRINDNSYLVSRYTNGILCISEYDKIAYIIAEKYFHGKTRNGIKINDSARNVVSRYGKPDDIQYFSIGNNMIYRNHGISFQIVNNKIKSWLLFRG
jgi:tetratricopeptide (TPR) repeat protein